jgi:hypothetical protein
MSSKSRSSSRRGAVLPLVVICMFALIGMMALAIDIGMIAVSRSQCQNAADSGAMAGARTINGDDANNYNYSAVPGQAITATSFNKVLGKAVDTDPAAITTVNSYTYKSKNVTIEAGAYTYFYDDSNASNEGFKVLIPRADTTEPYSAVRCTVNNTNNYSFGRIFGLSTFNTSAQAVAVHRPRDVVIIMDLSGSMRFQSLPGTPYYGARTTSMNPDTAYPQFGHYADTAGAALFGNSSIAVGTGEYYDPANISVSTNSGPPIIEDFYANAVGVAPSASNRAFTRSANGYATAPGGDNFLKTSLNTGATYAHTAKEFNNNSSTTIPKFEINGYGNYATFNGYTEGPGYWGKTFFVWPPSPGFVTRANWSAPTSLTDTTYKWYSWNNSYPRDWRQRYFVAVDTTNGNRPGVILHNTILFDSAGNLMTPGTTTTVTENGLPVIYTFRINYAAILYWLQQSPVHFPSTMQAGRIRYYTAIPSGTDNTLNNRWWTTAPDSLPNNEKFWKEYIDLVLGYYAFGNTASSYISASSYMGNGPPYTWSGSTIQVGQHVDRLPASPSINPTTPYLTGTTGPYQSSTTGAYMTGTTSAAKSTGATSVPVNSLPVAPVANTNYVVFGGNATLYKITNSNKTTLNISPALVANVAKNASVTIYSSNNGVGATAVSLGAFGIAPTVNSEYVGFNNSAANLYKFSAYTSKTIGYELTLSSGLAAAVNVSGATVESYVSNGSIGTTTISVTGLAQNPVVNSDYVVFNGDFTNPYLITGVATKGSARVLTFSPALAAAVSVNGASVQIYSPYMDYADDVQRPKHQFWFGAQTWVDWLGNYNLDKFGWPGNVHEAQAWACKVGIQTAIDDIKNNHPSDFVGLAFFSSPAYSTAGGGQHNKAVVPLGRNYQQLKDSLWFPPSTVVGGVSEITPYDTDFDNVPRAHGSTAPGMGFMIAYNMLSSSITTRLYAQPQPTYRGSTGGLGRKGANRLIIFETDGVPNTRAYAGFNNAGADSYYKIRVKYPENLSDSSNEFPGWGTYASSEVYDVVDILCNLETDANPGFSTARKRALVYPLAYGSLFDPANSGAQQNNALDFMQNVAYKGNTATTTSGADFPDGQRIYGTNTQRINRMQAAFTSIMQSGVQVSLIQ